MNPDREFSRRQFVKSSGALLGATLLAPNLLAEKPVASPAGKKRDIKKAMMLSAMPPGKGTLAERFRWIKAAGFEGVEPRGGMNHDDILKACAETGLKIA